jgi:hypothetical protein
MAPDYKSLWLKAKVDDALSGLEWRYNGIWKKKAGI